LTSGALQISPSTSDAEVAGSFSFSAEDKSFSNETNLNEARSLSSQFESIIFFSLYNMYIKILISLIQQ
jgi:hypothetical protein